MQNHAVNESARAAQGGRLAEEWRDGRAGALKTGVLHGGWCAGCCWALMAALFALGVMSLGWMVFVAEIIAVEKLVPWRRIATQAWRSRY